MRSAPRLWRPPFEEGGGDVVAVPRQGISPERDLGGASRERGVRGQLTDHVTNGRYIFGCSGFPNAFFSEQRGLSFENPPRADGWSRWTSSRSAGRLTNRSTGTARTGKAQGSSQRPQPMQQPLPMAVAWLTPDRPPATIGAFCGEKPKRRRQAAECLSSTLYPRPSSRRTTRSVTRCWSR